MALEIRRDLLPASGSGAASVARQRRAWSRRPKEFQKAHETMGKPWENHGKTTGKPWENHGKTMGKPWEKW